MKLRMQIMQLSGIITLVHVLVISVNGFLDYDIIEGYFQEKFINRATIIGCFSEKEYLNCSKRFAMRPMKIVININKTDAVRYLESCGHLGVILDGDCKGVHRFLYQSGKGKFFDEKHHWLILSSVKNFRDIFENVEMYINSDIQIIYPQEGETLTRSYIIEEVYNPLHNNGVVKHRKIGFYDTTNGLTIRKERGCKYWIRRNMTAVTLDTIVVLPVPFEGELLDYLNSENNREVNTFNRFHYNVMSNCQRFYNFSVRVNLSKSWGYKQKDGSFDGLVGALERRQVDYGSSPLFFRTPRAEVIQYGRKTWTLRAAFVFRNPKSTNSIQGFVKPLSFSMWAFTVITALLLLVFLRFSCLCELKNAHRPVDVTWSYFVICTIGALCQQGMTTTPHLSSGRIVALFMFLFALLIYQFYSASLVSHLLMKAPSRITSVEDILHSNMRVGCEDTLYNKDYFKYTTDKHSKELYLVKLMGSNNSNFLQPEEGLKMVAKGQYAFHVELATAYPIIRNTFREKAICELREINLYRDQPMHANYQKGSPYKEIFDTCLQRLAEVGILTRETLFWHPVKPDCLQSSRSVTFNIGLDDFYPALMVLGIGIFFSLVTLLFEVFVSPANKIVNKKRKKSIAYPFVK